VLLTAAVASTAVSFNARQIETLGRTLDRMQMGALLAYLAEQTGDDALTIKALLFQARDETDPQRRDAMLKRAAALMQQRIDALKQKVNTLRARDGKQEELEEAQIAYFRNRLEYAEVQALQRGKPYIDRLLFLLAGPEDEKALAELAGQAADSLRETLQELKLTLIDARGDLTSMVYLVPELEDLENQIRYNAAKIRYFAAAVQPTTTEQGKPNESRRRLLEKAADDLQPFATNPDYGVQGYSLLMQGRCYRQLGEYDRAASLFEQSLQTQPEGALGVEVLFEMARNRIEQGASLIRQGKIDAGNDAFKQARQALDDFSARATQYQSDLGVDVKRMVLGYYLYDTWASALREAKKPDLAAGYDRKAQQMISDFLEKYPQEDIRMGVAELFQQKFRGRDIDPATMDPVLVGLLAFMDYAEANQLLNGRSVSDLPADQAEQVRQKMEKAKTLFQAIRDSEKPSAEKALPDALWYLGIIHVQQLDNFNAAECFRTLAKRFPKHPNAKSAALNAVKIAETLIADQQTAGKLVSPKRRLELIESLQLLLNNWPDDPDAPRYHASLAEQAERLARSAENEEKYNQWITLAITHYERVPQDAPEYLAARFYALELRYEQLMQQPAGQDRQQAASALRQRLVDYGRQAHDLWLQAQADTARKNDLGQWGSTAEFRAAVINYEMLAQREPALATIRQLPDRWPQTRILQESQAFLIRKLLEQGQVAQALAQFDAFQKQYGEESAQNLMEEVVTRLQAAIVRLEQSGENPQQLAQFRQAYLSFAEQIYKSKATTATGQEKYRVTLLLADALTQSGQADNARRALGLYQQLQQINQARQAEQTRRIESAINRRIEQIDQATTPAQVKQLADGLSQTLQQFDMGEWRSAQMADVKLTQQQLAKADTPAGRQEWMDQARKAVRKAYQALREQLKQQVTIDATVLMGMARSYQLSGDYAQAIPLYRKLDAGLNPNDFPRLYWETQLGMVQSMLAANRNNPAELRKLVVLIRQLRTVDENMGGRRYLRRFNTVEAEAKRLSR
jgi:hypothetical protein